MMMKRDLEEKERFLVISFVIPILYVYSSPTIHCIIYFPSGMYFVKIVEYFFDFNICTYIHVIFYFFLSLLAFSS